MSENAAVIRCFTYLSLGSQTFFTHNSAAFTDTGSGCTLQLPPKTSQQTNASGDSLALKMRPRRGEKTLEYASEFDYFRENNALFYGSLLPCIIKIITGLAQGGTNKNKYR